MTERELHMARALEAIRRVGRLCSVPLEVVPPGELAEEGLSVLSPDERAVLESERYATEEGEDLPDGERQEQEARLRSLLLS